MNGWRVINAARVITPTDRHPQTKAYKPNKTKDGLEEIQISQFTYPLTDRKRGPCPAGGYF